jgi:hypothetical protein
MIDLSFGARLFYMALWCEADREGRLKWNLRSLKVRCFPEQDINLGELAEELIEAGHIVIYGDNGEFCHLPTFKDHQQINIKEAVSVLPDPSIYLSLPDVAGTCEDLPVSDDTGKHVDSRESTDIHMNPPGERKGKEGKGKERTHTAREPEGWLEFCQAYPAKPNRNQSGAKPIYERNLKRIEPKTMIDGANRYRKFCERQRTESRFIAQMTTWLNQNRWEENYGEGGLGSNGPHIVPVNVGWLEELTA